MVERIQIGVLKPQPRLGLFRAVCNQCTWHWTGSQKEAGEHLRGHVRLQHPEDIPVYYD